MENLEEFKKLVKQMREHQKSYFATKSYDALRNSKNLEKQVDNILDDQTEMNFDYGKRE